ncbi:MAG: hypothetical protein AAF657_38470, partial [Acidobacteriota bacterium]
MASALLCLVSAAAALLCLVSAAAAGSLTASGAHSAITPLLEVEYAGCHSVLPGPVCVAPPGAKRMRLWVRTPGDTQLEVAGGGHRIAERVLVQDGERLDLELDDTAPELIVRAAVGRQAVGTWSLALRPFAEPLWRVQSKALWVAGDLAGTEKVVSRALASGLPAAERGLALRSLAKIAMERGSLVTAECEMVEAISAFQAAGRTLEEFNCRLEVSLWSSSVRPLDERSPIEDAQAHRLPAEASWTRDYLRGYVASQVGDLRGALQWFRQAARLAERVGLDDRRRSAEQLLAVNMHRIGRHIDAARIFDRLQTEVPPEADACRRADLVTNIAWGLLLAHEAEAESATDPLPWLEEALELPDAGCLRSSSKRANLQTNLALAHLQDQRFGLAEQHLAQARQLAVVPELPQLLWWHDIEARIELGAGRAQEALDLYDTMAHLAAVALSPEAEWRSRIGRAQAHRALDQADQALSQLAEAEKLLDSASLRVPVEKGRA